HETKSLGLINLDQLTCVFRSIESELFDTLLTRQGLHKVQQLRPNSTPLMRSPNSKLSERRNIVAIIECASTCSGGFRERHDTDDSTIVIERNNRRALRDSPSRLRGVLM